MRKTIKSKKSQISLKVEPAYTRDLYRGLARIDYDAMDKLGIQTNSTIEVIGSKKTVARVLPLYPSDDGMDMIRIDELTNENAGTEQGKIVQIRKIQVVPAIKILVTPAEPVPQGTETYLRDYIKGHAIIKGQKLVIPYFREWFEFIVKSCTPSRRTVLFTEKTEFIISAPKRRKYEKEFGL
jgi:transitional endoplasmic reticulum ATPase